MHPVISRIRDHASHASPKLAVRFRGQNYPYAVIDSMVSDRAQALRNRGVRTADVVALEAVRGLNALIDLGALWTLQCTVLPYPTGSEGQLIRNMVQRANAQWILPPGGVPRPGVAVTEHPLAEEQTALILPTSGSTGEPKLVPLPTTALEAFTDWAENTFSLSRRTVLGFAPINFDLSLLEIWATLSAGGTVDLISDEEALNPRALRDHLRDSPADLIQAVPFVFQTLGTAKDEQELVMPGFRDVIVTGSKANSETRRLMVSSFPNAHFHNVYGSTETNNSFMFTAESPQTFQTENPPIGKPLAGVEAHILDHDGNVLAGQATGELHVRTPFMMSGYLGSDRDRSSLFPTGDVVFRGDDGVHHIESRSSRIVKVRGNRTNLDQVEAVIEAHPSVEESVVIARTDPGEELRVDALVKLRSGVQSSVLTLRTHCSKHLPAYAMPGTFKIVPEPFPRTSTHKIDRNASELIHYEGTSNA